MMKTDREPDSVNAPPGQGSSFQSRGTDWTTAMACKGALPTAGQVPGKVGAISSRQRGTGPAVMQNVMVFLVGFRSDDGDRHASAVAPVVLLAHMVGDEPEQQQESTSDPEERSSEIWNNYTSVN